MCTALYLAAGSACDESSQSDCVAHLVGTALQNGSSKPHSGCIERGMGDAIGAPKILAILEAMQSFYRDPRYRPSPWLKRRAKLGVSLLTPE